MTPIRFGLIGCGFVADFYMATAAARPGVEIVRAYDHVSAHAERFERHWGVPALTDPQAFYDGLDVDAILNLTNPSSHYDVSRTALERGYPVWSEKPIAMDIDEIFALEALAAERGLALASAPCNHLSEAFATLRAGLEAGYVGRPVLAYAEMEDGFVGQAPYEAWINPSGAPWPYRDEFAVGCTLEHAGYALTWLIALFGSVREVHAFGGLQWPGKPCTPGETEAEDVTIASLRFESGLIARVTCGIIGPHDHALRVFCEEGVMRAEDCWFYDTPVSFRRHLKIRRKFLLSPLSKRLKPAAPALAIPKTGSAQMDFIRGPVEMVEATREGRASNVPGDFCVHFNEVALGIHASIRSRSVYETRSRVDSMTPVVAQQSGHPSMLQDRLIPAAEKVMKLVKR